MTWLVTAKVLSDDQQFSGVVLVYYKQYVFHPDPSPAADDSIFQVSCIPPRTSCTAPIASVNPLLPKVSAPPTLAYTPLPPSRDVIYHDQKSSNHFPQRPSANTCPWSPCLKFTSFGRVRLRRERTKMFERRRRYSQRRVVTHIHGLDAEPHHQHSQGLHWADTAQLMSSRADA